MSNKEIWDGVTDIAAGCFIVLAMICAAIVMVSFTISVVRMAFGGQP